MRIRRGRRCRRGGRLAQSERHETPKQSVYRGLRYHKASFPKKKRAPRLSARRRTVFSTRHGAFRRVRRTNGFRPFSALGSTRKKRPFGKISPLIPAVKQYAAATRFSSTTPLRRTTKLCNPIKSNTGTQFPCFYRRRFLLFTPNPKFVSAVQLSTAENTMAFRSRRPRRLSASRVCEFTATRRNPPA